MKTFEEVVELFTLPTNKKLRRGKELELESKWGDLVKEIANNKHAMDLIGSHFVYKPNIRELLRVAAALEQVNGGEEGLATGILNCGMTLFCAGICIGIEMEKP